MIRPRVSAPPVSLTIDRSALLQSRPRTQKLFAPNLAPAVRVSPLEYKPNYTPWCQFHFVRDLPKLLTNVGVTYDFTVLGVRRDFTFERGATARLGVGVSTTGGGGGG